MIDPLLNVYEYSLLSFNEMYTVTNNNYKFYTVKMMYVFKKHCNYDFVSLSTVLMYRNNCTESNFDCSFIFLAAEQEKLLLYSKT